MTGSSARSSLGIVELIFATGEGKVRGKYLLPLQHVNQLDLLPEGSEDVRPLLLQLTHACLQSRHFT